jgi:hypothetical protein
MTDQNITETYAEIKNFAYELAEKVCSANLSCNELIVGYKDHSRGISCKMG